eukprot:TRINITY_DN613_c0_g1_i1.p1 TRINITY_DN613_c0_g1~~TRINITY_DN613_c0_g1_i1.p1  ORF type:complete len:266 (-),score=58.61 TRINITY_DN613_c0_g1_i1:70-867(-)
MSNQPVKFQIISDIHIEFPNVMKTLSEEALYHPRAPYLALLGDIGYPHQPNYRELLLQMANLYKKVFVIAGNHEFYKTEYYATKKGIQNICDEHPNLIFMDKASVLVDGIRIIGATLWTYISEEDAGACSRGINDYHLIRVADSDGRIQKLTVPQSVEWFQEDLAYIKAEVEKAKNNNEKVVVFTHHAPSRKGTSDPQFDGSQMNAAFATNLEYLLGSPICLWAFGHTHYSSDQIINGTRVASNQVGYLMMAEKSNFEPGKVFEV